MVIFYFCSVLHKTLWFLIMWICFLSIVQLSNNNWGLEHLQLSMCLVRCWVARIFGLWHLKLGWTRCFLKLCFYVRNISHEKTPYFIHCSISLHFKLPTKTSLLWRQTLWLGFLWVYNFSPVFLCFGFKAKLFHLSGFFNLKVPIYYINVLILFGNLSVLMTTASEMQNK